MYYIFIGINYIKKYLKFNFSSLRCAELSITSETLVNSTSSAFIINNVISDNLSCLFELI